MFLELKLKMGSLEVLVQRARLLDTLGEKYSFSLIEFSPKMKLKPPLSLPWLLLFYVKLTHVQVP